MNLQKIISGGQTGADQGGLEAAEALSIPTGGFIPKGFRTADGPRPDLAERFGLIEHSAWGYPPRTRTNIAVSDLTICFGDVNSSGSKLTKRYCFEAYRPFVNIPYPLYGEGYSYKHIISFLLVTMKQRNPQIINIAGNRESVNPGIQEFTKNILIEVLKQYME